MFAPCCLQVEGGSNPFGLELWSASLSALISALGAAFFGFGLADMDDMAALPWCELEPLSPAQMPSPATARISTPSSAAGGTTAAPLAGPAAAGRQPADRARRDPRCRVPGGAT